MSPEKNTHNSVEMLDPDQCAAQAELAYSQLTTFGRRQLHAALHIGTFLTLAKQQLGHGKFGAALKRWRAEAVITFSHRSANRWLLLAKHAKAIKSASVANLQEAEALASILERGGENPATDLEPAKKSVTVEAALRDIEDRTLKALRKLKTEDQSRFLIEIMNLVKKRLEALAT